MYIFALKNYRHVNGVEEEFRKLQIKSYVYKICTPEDTIKIGVGNDFEWQSNYWGNRLVRQIDGLYGWQLGERYTGCENKKIFRSIIDSHFPTTNKNDVTCFVFDYTREYADWNERQTKKLLEDKEGAMVNAYLEQHGRKPFGNPGKVRGEVQPNNFLELFHFS